MCKKGQFDPCTPPFPSAFTSESRPVKEKEPTYRALLDSIESQLRHGQLRLGDRLPAERTLAEEFGISRASVREALRILSTVGLIRSGVGSGPRAGALIVSQPSDALGWALRMHIATRTLPVEDIVSTRILLEGEAAARAAQLIKQAKEGQAEAGQEEQQAIARARTYLEEMDQTSLSDQRFHFCDTRFHYELSSLGGNIVMDTVIDSLHLATVSYVQEALPYLADWQATKAQLQKQHRAILAAILEGDSQKARKEVAQHIRWFYALSEVGASPSP